MLKSFILKCDKTRIVRIVSLDTELLKARWTSLLVNARQALCLPIGVLPYNNSIIYTFCIIGKPSNSSSLTVGPKSSSYLQLASHAQRIHEEPSVFIYDS